MLRNHLRLALRGLRKRGGYAAIHLAGLAVGMACCLLVALYVHDELRFDRFHTDAERIAVVMQDFDFGGQPIKLAITDADLLGAIETELPAVERVTRTGHFAATVTPEGAAEGFVEDDALTADADFFEVFDGFALVRGDPATALAEPNTAVVTETAARRYFGDTDPVGKTLHLRRRGFAGIQTDVAAEAIPFRVTGVARDVPSTSSITFSLLVAEPPAEGGLSFGGQTYVLLREGAAPEDLAAALPALAATHGDEAGLEKSFSADPLVAQHLSSERALFARGRSFSGDLGYLYLFSAVALFVLLLAAINYVNLATAYAAERGREVGVQKALGAGRGQLAARFLTEALALSAAAAGFALGLALLAVPGFNALFGTAVGFDWPGDLWAVGALAGLAALVGLGAGAYPAFHLARLRPVQVLGGQQRGGRGGRRLRQGLVVAQFAVTVVLLVGTAAVFGQLRFMQDQPLGLDADRVVALTLGDEEVARRAQELKRAALAQPGVLSASASTAVPGGYNVRTQLAADTSGAGELPVAFVHADPDHLATYGIELAQEFGLGEAIGERAVHLLNEAGARALGTAGIHGGRGDMRPLDGVVRDYHFDTLQREIEPLYLILNPKPDKAFARLSVKVEAGREAEALAGLRAEWRRLAPGRPFEYEFVDDLYAEGYAHERRLGTIFGVFAGLAVFVACLGLLGLAAFSARRRTKEVGIRKVLGASAASVVALLSREFVVLVGLAFALAAPAAYLLVERWLESFAFHAPLGPAPFLLAGGLALAVALLTVSAHALRAATADPVQSLRHE